jgi:hypothetical protein
MTNPLGDESLVTGASEAVLSSSEANPYAPPAMPVIVERPKDTPLVSKLKRKTGNDLIIVAMVATFFGWFIPFGIVLDFVSLFLLARVIISRSKPDVVWIVLGVMVAMWNALRIGIVMLVLAAALLQQ